MWKRTRARPALTTSAARRRERKVVPKSKDELERVLVRLLRNEGATLPAASVLEALDAAPHAEVHRVGLVLEVDPTSAIRHKLGQDGATALDV
jgi:hypothetical protein